VLWLSLASLLAADDGTLENTGKPMSVAFSCNADELQASGSNCSEDEPCHIFLELSGVEAAGNRIFVAGDIHTATATLQSILLSSDDAGKTWSEPHPRMRFTELDQIQFIDFETGWISGANTLSTPHDPFLLLTTDGGKTWHERPIYDDGRPGVIEKFWFESRSNGMMLVVARYENRHELYETMTGGESWSLRHTSADPIPFPRSKSAAINAWRLRPDAATHSFAVERSQGERWQKMAGFLVEIAKCAQ
jgi:hypothetical protein